GNTSYLLDLTPATSDWSDPALVVGQSFSDSTSGVTITPTSGTGTAAGVTVGLSGPPCTRSNPTVTFSPSQSQWVTPSSIVGYTVTVVSNDSSACTASAFSVQASAPTGWSTTLASSSLTMSPGATRSTTLQVVSPSSTV